MVRYDVLAALKALAAVGVDAAVVLAVADAVGHLATSTPDEWRACGVSATKVIEARRLLTPCENYGLVCVVLATLHV